MPINAGAEYYASEHRYLKAKTNEEKLAALQEMLRTAPKHKGSENLLAEITTKIKKTRDAIDRAEEQRKKSASGRALSVRKEGIGQVVLVGVPNSGKSTILKALTKADIAIGSHPFTTKKPEVGMVDYKGAMIQLVEIPPLIPGSSSGKAQGKELLSIIRTADGIAIVLDACDAIKEFNILKREFENSFIVLNKKKPRATITKSQFPGITIAGQKYLRCPVDELKRLLKVHNMHHVSVVIEEKMGLDEIEEVLNDRLVYKKAIAFAVEKNCKLSPDIEKVLAKEMLVEKISVFNEEKVSRLKDLCYTLTDKILIYTKKPGDKAAVEPLAMPKGSTIDTVAKILHKDFAMNLKYAKVWGSTKYNGQRVSKDYALQDNDIVEIYS